MSPAPIGLPGPERRLANTLEFVPVGRRLLLEVGRLPGVERVFPPSSAVHRWFVGPITHFEVQGRSIQAWITIAVGRYQSIAATTGLVAAYVRARLLEQQFDFIEIRVRVALLI